MQLRADSQAFFFALSKSLRCVKGKQAEMRGEYLAWLCQIKQGKQLAVRTRTWLVVVVLWLPWPQTTYSTDTSPK
jgi:hypothetical protein